ncbi:MAG: MscL family protein [Bacilli bacterium]|nr:MscL family protein [Bacilli bacterium]
MAKREHKLWNEFKAFISRGNAFDMAVGVVIGGAFSAIVTALVNILMSLATWAVPGGINGLVTVLPALNAAQSGMDEAIGLGQYFAMSDLQGLAIALANKQYGVSVVEANPNLIESVKTTILSKYTLHGTTYTYNMSAVIDWGALINAFISFLIIAVTLFVVVKVVNTLRAARLAAEEKAKAALVAKEAEEKAEEKAEEPAEEKPAE